MSLLDWTILACTHSPTLSAHASKETTSLNLARHNTASCMRTTPSRDKVKLNACMILTKTA